jgi:cell division protein FtsB
VKPAGDSGQASGRSGVFGRRGTPAEPRGVSADPGRVPADPRGAADSGLASPSPVRPKFTSRAAVLVVVVCAIGLSLAYPIREYIADRRQIDQLQGEDAQLSAKLAALRSEQRAATTPAFIEQQARDRLKMCFPTQICYVVIAPVQRHGKIVRSQPATPWYGALWASVSKADGTPPKPSR